MEIKSFRICANCIGKPLQLYAYFINDKQNELACEILCTHRNDYEKREMGRIGE